MLSASCPAIFNPLNLRSTLKYRSLGRHRFSLFEKFWACVQILNSAQDLDVDLEPAIHGFCKRYVIPLSSVIEWINIFVNDHNYDNDSEVESDCPLDSVGISAISEAVRVGSYSNESPSCYDNRLYDLLDEHLKRTADCRV